MSDFEKLYLLIKEFSKISEKTKLDDEKTYIYIIYDDQQNILFIKKSNDVFSEFKPQMEKTPNAFVCHYVQVNKEEASDIEFFLVDLFLPKNNTGVPSQKLFYTLEEYELFAKKPNVDRKKVLDLLELHNIKNIYGYFHKNELDVIFKFLGEKTE